MENPGNKGVIIQARMGSTRLPAKMAKCFSNGKTLLEVILQKLLPLTDFAPVIVATTENIQDDFIENVSENLGVPVFRGSEDDVMLRFIEAADAFGIDSIIRICGDNPFIQTPFVETLCKQYNDNMSAYIGFRLLGSLPAIKSHLGFFPEMIKTKALKEVYDNNPGDLFKEHVTNFFYDEQNKTYPVIWIDLNYPEEMVRQVRLTIDTEEDFEIAGKIYHQFPGNGNSEDSPQNIFEYLQKNPGIIDQMKENIRKNEK